VGFTARAGSNLGSAGKPSGTVGVGAGAGCVLVTVAEKPASYWSAVTWLLLAGERAKNGWIPQVFVAHPRR
jgi:hypothetical protein